MTVSVYYGLVGAKDGTSDMLSYGWKGPNTNKRAIRTKGSDAALAIAQSVGYSYPQTIAGTRRLRRELPEGVPFLDTTMYCAHAAISKWEKWKSRTCYDATTYAPLPGYPNRNITKDADGNPTDSLYKTNDFQWAQITQDYAAADFFIRSDNDIDSTYAGNEINRFTSYREDRQVKGLTLQAGMVYWIRAGHTDSIPFGIPRIEFEKTIYVKWHQVAVDAIPWTTIDNMIAKINKTTFLGIYPPDTLLMMPPRVDRYPMANGLIGCDVEFCYGYTPNLQTRLLYQNSSPAAAAENLTYKWVTGDASLATGADPTPGTLADGKYLFNEAEFLDCYLPSNP